MTTNYEEYANKTGVYKAVSKLDTGISPNTFCRLFPLGGGKAQLMHTDGVGTKGHLAYLYYRETKDESVWRNIAEDAIVMNLDDASCCGGLNNPIYFTLSITRDPKKIQQRELEAIIDGFDAYLKNLVKHRGFDITFCGGETEDVNDLASSIFINATLSTTIDYKNILPRVPSAHIFHSPFNENTSGYVIGLGGYGTTKNDSRENSGIGCNGLSVAREVLLDSKKFDLFSNPYGLPKNMNIGQALLCPTRSFTAFIRAILSAYYQPILALAHNTGGGVLKGNEIMKDNLIHVNKNNLHDPPPIFKIIQKNCNLDMYKIFNMGQRLEIYTNEDKDVAEKIVKNAETYYKIPARIIGTWKKVEKREDAGITIFN